MQSEMDVLSFGSKPEAGGLLLAGSSSTGFPAIISEKGQRLTVNCLRENYWRRSSSLTCQLVMGIRWWGWRPEVAGRDYTV